MPVSILERPICYSTFVTEEVSGSGLKRCTRCRCAWYKSVADQRANWPTHKKVCKRPDYDVVSKMTFAQCMGFLRKMGQGPPSHNTAAVFERVFDLMRSDIDEGKNEIDNGDAGFDLHAFSRRRSLSLGDGLEDFYRCMWSSPGMPQLLYFTDFRSSSLRKMMKEYPAGRPSFDDEDDECDFDMEYDLDTDTSGESIAWFIVGFLVRSCVWGGLSMSSNHDGIGNLRDTSYATAARARLAEIFSSKVLRTCALKALYPVPGLMKNFAERKPDAFFELLNMGVGPGIISWADQEYGRDALRIMCSMEMSDLLDDRKLDLLEVCCSVFEKHAHFPWDGSTSEETEDDLKNLCLKLTVNLMSSATDVKGLLATGMERRPESVGPQWIDDACDRKRLVLAFLFEKLTPEVELSEESLSKFFEEWANLKKWDRTKYAEQVLLEKSYQWYCKQAKDLLEFSKELKARKEGN